MKRSVGVLSALVMISCGDTPSEVLWISNKSVGSQTQLVWQDQTNWMYLDKAADAAQFERTNLVMVRIAPGQYEPEYWQKKQNVLRLTLPHALEFGHALVDVKSTDEHLELARLAHQSGGCGNIDPIWLNRTLLEGSAQITPTVLHERIHLDDVTALLDDVKRSNIAAHIKELANMGTRMHTTKAGKKTPDEIMATWQSIGAGLSGFSVRKHTFSESEQANVVARIAGRSDPDTIVIIGAHMDTINLQGDVNAAPGADDDASGVATITEILRVLSDAGVSFDRTVEFHAYGAEEVGRYGSIALAESYRDEKKHVAGMFQIDMNAYSQNPDDQTIFFTREFTNEYLNRVNKDLLQTYLGGGYEEKSLLAGTSDHKSWHQAGFPTVFPFEDPENFNPTIHTSEDTYDQINNTAKSARFAKLGLAYISHLAGLVAAKDAHAAALEAGAPESAAAQDLAVAVVSAAKSAKFYLVVAADTQIMRVEACRIKEHSSVTCAGARKTYTNLGARNGRQFFLNETPASLRSGERFRLYGYDMKDELVVLRNIKLKQRS